MEEGALLRLDDGGRLDAKEGSLQHLVKASPRRYGSIAILNLASSLGPLRPASASTEPARPLRFAAHSELVEVPDCRYRKSAPRPPLEILVAFLFIGSQDLKISGGESVRFLLLGEGRVLINKSFN